MIRRIRASFGARVLVLTVAAILVVGVGIGSVVFYLRVSETRGLEREVALRAVDLLRRNIDEAGAGAVSFTARVAAYPPVGAALAGGDEGALSRFLDEEAATLPASTTLVVTDATGRPLLARSGGNPPGAPAVSAFSANGAVHLAGAGGGAARSIIEKDGPALSLDAAAPVRLGDHAVGFVLESVNLDTLLRASNPVGNELQLSIFYRGQRVATTFPAGFAGQGLPEEVSSNNLVATSFATYKVGGRTFAGYFGPLADTPDTYFAAEVDDAVFAAQLRDELITIALTIALMVTVLSLVALVLARRFVLRPLAALGGGADRVGAGDYGARVKVDTGDDFERLAGAFNSMAERIRANTSELESQRARLDSALSSLGAVSTALNTTTAGSDRLRHAVLDAVVEVTGASAAAMYAGRDRAEAALGMRPGEAAQLARGDTFRDRLAAGGGAFVVAPGSTAFAGWHGVVVPMTSQGQVVGALAAYDAVALDAVDLPALTVLASQAATALENSQLFERERETVERLQELDAMKSDFLATIQHELRTPLTAIIGMTDLMEMCWQAWEDGQKLDALGEVQLAAKGLFELVETILDFSMLESDRLRLHISSTSLRQAVDAAVEDMEAVVARSGARVTVDVSPRLRVQADSRRLVQVIKALLDNAVKFGPEGGRVKISASPTGGKVELRVADRGIGIAPEHLSRIFERFYQVDNTATRRHGGTGMGLALAERLVKMHGGTIRVASTPDKGSEFTVILDAGVVAEAPSPKSSGRNGRAAGNGHAGPAGKLTTRVGGRGRGVQSSRSR